MKLLCILTAVFVFNFGWSSSAELSDFPSTFERAIETGYSADELSSFIVNTLSRQNVHSVWKRSVDDFLEDIEGRLGGRSLLDNFFDSELSQSAIKSISKRDLRLSNRGLSSVFQSMFKAYVEKVLTPYKLAAEYVIGNATEVLLSFYTNDTSSSSGIDQVVTTLSNTIILRVVEVLEQAEEYVQTVYEHIVGTITSSARKRRDVSFNALESESSLNALSRLIVDTLSSQNVHSLWKRSVDDFLEDIEGRLGGRSLLDNFFDSELSQSAIKSISKRDVSMSNRDLSDVFKDLLKTLLDKTLAPYKLNIQNVLENATEAVLSYYRNDTSSSGAVDQIVTSLFNTIILRVVELLELAEKYVDIAYEQILGTVVSSARRRRDVLSNQFDLNLAEFDGNLIHSRSKRSVVSSVSAVINNVKYILSSSLDLLLDLTSAFSGLYTTIKTVLQVLQYAGALISVLSGNWGLLAIVVVIILLIGHN